MLKNFNKRAKNYDEYAKIQQMIGHQLIKKMNYKKSSILDIGCGTGFFTELLVNKFTDSKITAIDSAPNMLDIAEQKTNLKNINFLLQNIEDSVNISPTAYDTITANAVIQWFNEPQKTLTNIYKSLKKGGEFYASTFGPNTFQELRETFYNLEKELNIKHEKHHLPLKDMNSWIDLLEKSNFKNIHTTKDNYIFTFDSCRDFLDSIQKTGSSISSTTYSFNNMRKIMIKFIEKYDELYRINSKVFATYEIYYISCNK